MNSDSQPDRDPNLHGEKATQGERVQGYCALCGAEAFKRTGSRYILLRHDPKCPEHRPRAAVLANDERP